ncbi:uncharacterized protein RCC_02875 [Ramularia collo-cygni]|uniref:Period circadian protein n=1 Tax=Ramularia collo-cygni TaxID=112498 RepID=A0A2D3V9F3_9PEZI|nr:uncharacterized protein RCC_02875 [Ramularia collo-cygni]CZT17043.1 uncharacterized protein RCC_02875 [Ramularia collo-cygni]
MRYAILAAPLVAIVYAQAESSSSISIPPYSNPATQYLTQTNSLGVVTGQPTLPGGGIVATSMPAVDTQVGTVATIPAGLPTGVTSIPIAVGNGTTPASYFTISVGSSTTVVLGAVPTGVSVSGVSGTASGPRGSNTGSSSNNNNNNNNDNDNDNNNSGGSSSSNNDDPSSTESSSSDSSEGAAVANSMVGASGAVLGLGALIAAML